MNISNTDFNVTLHSAELKGGNSHPEYHFFNSDTSCDLIINDSYYPIILQAGLSHYNDDYNLPSEDIDYSEEGGCDKFMVTLSQIGEHDIQNLDANLLEVYFYLLDLRINAQSELDREIKENGQSLIEE